MAPTHPHPPTRTHTQAQPALGNAGARVVANFLKLQGPGCAQQLCWLDLSGTDISDRGAESLLAVLQYRPTLLRDLTLRVLILKPPPPDPLAPPLVLHYPAFSPNCPLFIMQLLRASRHNQSHHACTITNALFLRPPVVHQGGAQVKPRRGIHCWTQKRAPKLSLRPHMQHWPWARVMIPLTGTMRAPHNDEIYQHPTHTSHHAHTRTRTTSSPRTCSCSCSWRC